MGLEPFLIEILVDPEDKESLYYFEDDEVLYNPRLSRTYAVRDGIPVLLIDEATALDADGRARLDQRLDVAVETGRPSAAS